MTGKRLDLTPLRGLVTSAGRGRHATAVDTVVALLLMLTSLGHAFAAHGPGLLLLNAALVLPLALRRTAPFPVFCVVAAVAFVQWLTVSGGMPSDVAVLLALHTVAVHCRRAQTWLAYGVCELGALLAALSWPGLNHRYGDGVPMGQTDVIVNTIKVFLLFSGTVTTALVLGFNVRARRGRLASLEQRALDLERQRDQQAALAVAEERSRIAREMHDIVTHNLSVMVALADGAVYANPHAPERATAAMRQSAETGRQALTDMRRFLGVLRADEPEALRHPQPGIGQLEALVRQVRAAGLPTELAVSGATEAVSPGAQLTVYRVVQESLTNTLKHAAGATAARVAVQVEGASMTVEISDDGHSGAVVSDGEGHGLIGMRERAAAFGGGLTAGPGPGGRGWRVSATFDLAEPGLEPAPAPIPATAPAPAPAPAASPEPEPALPDPARRPETAELEPA
ncbi:MULTISPECIES: sensor histidine kinase [Streptacidiphilus]|uniref:histidine kinase n=1 Tax=Streptacidiphilus cavernicola TaxID=3342716 RepID=A0ABV6UHR7_9ACTN|nr:histidine kinase [Streptacidiphilus jeojiense]